MTPHPFAAPLGDESRWSAVFDEAVPDVPDARAVLVAYLERFSAQDVDGILAMFAEEGTYTDPSLGGERITGEALRGHLQRLFAAVPDMNLTVLAAGADGRDTAVAYWSMSGTATGPNPSSNDGSFDLPGGDILHVDEQGRIDWTEALYDQKTFTEQGGFA